MEIGLVLVEGREQLGELETRERVQDRRDSRMGLNAEELATDSPCDLII